MLTACGGGGGGDDGNGGGDPSVKIIDINGGGDDDEDDDDGGDPGVNPGLNSGGGNPKSFGMMEGEMMDSTQMQDDMDIDMSGEMIGAPLFSLLSTRQNRWPHVKLRINGRNVIGFVDTGAGGYAFMDDDSARALGLGAEHLIRTARTDASGGWCPGAPGDFIDYSLYQADLEIGGLTISNAYIWARHDDDNNLFTPLIGNEVLSRFTMQWPYPPSSLSGESIELRGESAHIDRDRNIPFTSGAVFINGVETDDDNGPIRFLLDTGVQNAHAVLNLDSQEDAKIAEGGVAGYSDAAGRSCSRYAGSPVTLALPALPASITVAQSPSSNGGGIVITQRRNDINAFGTDFFRDGIQLLSAPGPNARDSVDASGWRMSYEAREKPANLVFCSITRSEEDDKVANGFRTIDPDCGGSF